MNKFVRVLISNEYLARSHVSSPKFYSPTNSQSEMPGHIPTTEGNLEHENEREKGTGQNESNQNVQKMRKGACETFVAADSSNTG